MVSTADRVDGRIGIQGNGIYPGVRHLPVVRHDSASYPRTIPREHPQAIVRIGDELFGCYDFVLFRLDNDAAYGHDRASLRNRALVDVRRIIGCRRPLSQCVTVTHGTPCAAPNTGIVAVTIGAAAHVDENAYCVRTATQHLPAVIDDPTLAAIAAALPGWTTFAALAQGMRGNHTAGHQRVLWAKLVGQTHVGALDRTAQYLLRPCSADGGAPQPHCIAAVAGVLYDGIARQPLSIAGMAALGYGPVVHSGRAVRQAPTKASRKRKQF